MSTIRSESILIYVVSTLVARFSIALRASVSAVSSVTLIIWDIDVSE